MRPSVGVVTVAPVLPLVVLLLVTGLSVAEDDSKNAIPIRLPTDITGLADLPTAMTRATTHGDKERPWKCCDLALCTRSYPPFCWCMDKVDRCSEACEKCKETEGSEGYICEDRYHGDPGPRCSEDDGRGLAALLGVSTTASRHAAAAWKKDDEKASRPWKCCDLQACTRSQPPTCRCRDVVKRCAKTCKRCEKVEGSDDNHTRYRCLDTYHGDPAPPCRRLMQRAVDAILRGYGY